MTTPNAELAYRVLDLALAHPDHFDMNTWAQGDDDEPVTLETLTGPPCGTTACLAGWTAAHAGWQVDSDGYAYNGDQREWAELIAADLLGLDEYQASDLFHASNSRVPTLFAEIFGPRPAPASAR